MSKVRFVGLDVHADTIAVAVAEVGGEVRSLGIIPNRLESIRKMIGKLTPIETLKCCYEAGPTGYVLYWQLTQLGVACEVMAPSLIPTKAGDRVKTDRRDAEKLARCYRAGELTAVWVPDANHEALRDLVRAREAAKKDQLRHRHRLGKFLLRHGKRPSDAGKAWTQKYLNWIRIHVHFEQAALEATLQHYREEVDHIAERIVKLEQAIDEAVKQAPPEIRAVIEALQALRGVAQTTAATVVAELGSLSRFASPSQLMGYSGLVSSERSSGNRVQRGAITKSGNAHLRRVLIESAWTYRHRPNVQGRVLRRQKSLALSEEAKRIAWKAQQRLYKRFTALTTRGKENNVAAIAVARELLGFMWAVAVHTESQSKPAKAA
ncbi:MAG TPA: IS110 family transposase [Bryobacteraceae bacterium]|jgi:transposase|nr:IS110 family transposase [Bryobacteraceae bacterium]